MNQSLRNLHSTVQYWKELRRSDSLDGREVAARIVNSVNSPEDSTWSIEHPAYDLIIAIAASLELPEEMTPNRAERWECIDALLSVLNDSVARSKR